MKTHIAITCPKIRTKHVDNVYRCHKWNVCFWKLITRRFASYQWCMEYTLFEFSIAVQIWHAGKNWYFQSNWIRKWWISVLLVKNTAENSVKSLKHSTIWIQRFMLGKALPVGTDVLILLLSHFDVLLENNKKTGGRVLCIPLCNLNLHQRKVMISYFFPHRKPPQAHNSFFTQIHSIALYNTAADIEINRSLNLSRIIIILNAKQLKKLKTKRCIFMSM